MSGDVILGEFSTDVTPPEVTNPSPANGAQLVAKDADVEFDITDLEAGVDTASVEVSVGGTIVFTGGAFATPTYDGTFVDMGGGTWHFALTTHPDLTSYTSITVTVDGQDLAPLANVMAQYSWSFTTEDYEGPYVDVGYAPTGAGVAVSSLITFDLKDDGSGVNIRSVVVTVGGVEAYNGADIVGGDPDTGFKTGFQGASSAVTGTPASYHFVIDADPDYAEYTTYEVIVNASDMTFPMSGYIHRFTLDEQVGGKYYDSIDPNVYLEAYGDGALFHETTVKFDGGIRFSNAGGDHFGGIGEDDSIIQGQPQRLAIIPNGAQAFSVGIWAFVPAFNPDSRLPGYHEYLISFGNPGASDGSWGVRRIVNTWTPGGDDGKFSVYYASFGSSPDTRSVMALQDDALHHLLLTREGEEMRLYLDGALWITHTCPASLHVSGGSEFQIGGMQTAGNWIPNDFKFDHCEWWSRRLSPAEAWVVSQKAW